MTTLLLQLRQVGLINKRMRHETGFLFGILHPPFGIYSLPSLLICCVRWETSRETPRAAVLPSPGVGKITPLLRRAGEHMPNFL